MIVRREFAGGAVLIIAWTLLMLFCGGHGHRVYRSLNPAMKSFAKLNERPHAAGYVRAAPKILSRGDAERLFAARWKQTLVSLKPQAPSRKAPASSPSMVFMAPSPSPSSSSSPSSSPSPTPTPTPTPTPAPAPPPGVVLVNNDSAKDPSNGKIFHVTNYGADPTGATDSTEAIMAAITDAFNINTKDHLMPGVPDLGGAEIHLQGGMYLISSPLRMPGGGGGNILIHGGTLRASDDFPTDRFLIELWSPDSQKISGRLGGADVPAALAEAANGDQTASYEDVTLRDLMLDANFRGGGVLVIHSVRTNIDNCYISHFDSYGIMVQGGHETYIRNSFLGQYITVGGSPNEKNFGGTAISLMGNDNAVTDVVIFSAAVGIEVTGQANSLIGVHCYNKATGFGGVGIKLRLPGLTQTRIIGCYMDYTGIVAEDPVQLDITNSFFLGDAFILLQSTSMRKISGVTIADNMFAGSGKGTAIVQLSGKFDTIEHTVVDRNNVKGMMLKSTVARGTVQGNGTSWTVDFSPFLLFPNLIRHVQYSFYTPLQSAFPRHALRSVSNNKVVIESDTPVPATVAVTVDQSATFVQGQGIYS